MSSSEMSTHDDIDHVVITDRGNEVYHKPEMVTEKNKKGEYPAYRPQYSSGKSGFLLPQRAVQQNPKHSHIDACKLCFDRP